MDWHSPEIDELFRRALTPRRRPVNLRDAAVREMSS
jgi:hypothetical protein